MIKKLVPYLHFQGNCEEALSYYKKILDGEVEIVNRYDNPAMQIPSEYQDKVLHARYTMGDTLIFASDFFPGRILERGNGDIALSLDVDSEEEAQRIFLLLSKGGEVIVPFSKQFWGAWHGNLIDKYGIKWMLNVNK